MFSLQLNDFFKGGGELDIEIFLRGRFGRVNNLFSTVLFCGAIVAASGCGKKEQAEASPPPAVATNPPAQPPTTGFNGPAKEVPPESVAAAPGGGADLKDLNHAYIRWIIQSHRHAKTFEEFVAASHISVPPAPAGKKYVIDKAGFVALINR